MMFILQISQSLLIINIITWFFILLASSVYSTICINMQYKTVCAK